MYETSIEEIQRAQNKDMEAMTNIIEKNSGLVWSIVKRFIGRGYETEDLYPDIYRIVNPVVEEVCNRNRNKNITEELVRAMTEEVYSNVEGNSSLQVDVQVKTELKNGDVRNPNVKKPETRQKNFLLNDLIRILILKNLLRPRPPVRPPFPGPGPRPPFPGPGPRPPYPGPGPRTPVM